MDKWARITYYYKGTNGWVGWSRSIFRPTNAPIAQSSNPAPYRVDIEIVLSKNGMPLEISEKFENMKPPKRYPLQLD